MASSNAFASSSRQFTQERARRTYESLVKAAFEVFADKGYDATQTPDIAARAGVSVGSFYRYFADKREIFLEIMKRHLARANDEVMAKLKPERFVGQGRREAIEDVMSVLLDVVTRFPKLQRVYLEMSLRDDDVCALRDRLENVSRTRVTEFIAAVCPPGSIADPEATAYVVHTAAIECAIHIAGFRGEPPLSRDRALAALTELVYRALFGPAAIPA